MAEQIQESDVISESQQGYVDDFFSDAGYELVNDDGSPVNQTQPRTAQTPEKTNAQQATNQQQQQQTKQPGQPTRQPVAGQPQKTPQAQPAQPPQQPQRSAFEATLYDEAGNLKDEAFDLFGFGDAGPTSYQREADATQPSDGQQAQPPQPDEPEWKRQYQEAQQYRQNLTQNYFSVANRARELIRAGYDPATAIDMAETEGRNFLEQHFHEREEEARFNSQKKFQDELSRTAEAAKLESLSIQNQAKLAQRWKGIDNYQQLMFAGANKGNLQALFDMMHPDMATMPSGKLGKELGQWWTKLSSNEKFLGIAHKLMHYEFLMQNMQGILQRTRQAAQSQARHNTEAGTRAVGRLTAHKAAPQQAGEQVDDLDKYLNGTGYIDEV